MQAEPWFYRCLTIPNVPNWCCEVAIVSSNLVPCFESQKGQGYHYCDFPQICNVARGLITIHDSPCWLYAFDITIANSTRHALKRQTLHVHLEIEVLWCQEKLCLARSKILCPFRRFPLILEESEKLQACFSIRYFLCQSCTESRRAFRKSESISLAFNDGTHPVVVTANLNKRSLLLFHLNFTIHLLLLHIIIRLLLLHAIDAICCLLDDLLQYSGCLLVCTFISCYLHCKKLHTTLAVK